MYTRDVFISHASVDKVTHANLLNEALRRRGVSTWIDEAQIGDGENFVQSIAWGLDQAEVIVFLITENFLGRRWAEKELTAALSKEISHGITRVIAILDVDDSEHVFVRFPLLRDKLYIPWSLGAEEIARRLSRRFSRLIANWHIASHPAEYIGEVWTRIVPDPKHSHLSHRVTLLWGAYRFTDEIQALSNWPVSLTHHKMKADALPLYVSIEPAAIVTVGQGPAPDADRINIDEGWVRLAGASINRELPL